MLAVSGYMRPDPYSGAPGVEEVAPGVYRVTVRLASARGDKRITFTLRLGETIEQSRLVFSPLLNRFLAGEPYDTRPVKISDSGRIRNELQTLCAEALEFVDSHDDPGPLRPHPAGGHLARQAEDAAARCSAGTRNVTRCGSRGWSWWRRRAARDHRYDARPRARSRTWSAATLHGDPGVEVVRHRHARDRDAVERRLRRRPRSGSTQALASPAGVIIAGPLRRGRRPGRVRALVICDNPRLAFARVGRG